MTSTVTTTTAPGLSDVAQEVKSQGFEYVNGKDRKHLNGSVQAIPQADRAAKPRSGWNINAAGRFEDYPSDISNFLIPSYTGAGTVTNAIQRKTKLGYLVLVGIGLVMFYCTSSPRLRTAGVSMIFPGAGFLSVGGIGGIIGFVITLVLLPLCLFAWFGAGGLAFPLADWIFSGCMATYFVGPTISESSAVITLGFVAVIYTYLQTKSDCEDSSEAERRDRRNTSLPEINRRWVESSVAAGPAGSRELTLDQLRFIQHVLELAMRDVDDWEGFTIIDQFQPAALRYQLYEFVSVLATYQCIFAPNFHGVLSAAMRNAIDKSLLPKVLNFWKWESLWGKFTTNYDPVTKDNIMVTGFLILAICLYESGTGDDRYTKQDSLNMQITDSVSYKHNVQSLYKALVANWDQSSLALYPCEPNWVYSMCNLSGMAAATIFDRLHGTREGTRVMKRFYKHFEEDFFTRGGSCVPIKSSLTGFTIPGLCGVLGDCANAVFCTPSMPLLAKRMWLLTREENVRYGKDGKIEIVNLKGADKIDGGNYEASLRGPYGHFALAAAEWGDDKIAAACLKRIDEEFAPVEENPTTGSKRSKGMSALNNAMLARARFMQGGDWATTVSKGPPKTAMQGPILDSAPYPQVLVAKAYSHTGKDLELVLYPGRNNGTFTIGLTRLQPGRAYEFQNGNIFQADSSGKATLKVDLDGRTRVQIELSKEG